MTFSITLALVGACLALTVFAAWRGARPPDFARGPRLIPWRGIMVFGAAATLLFLVHLANLMGVQTGRR